MNFDADELPDDPRLVQAVQEYLALIESGQRPDRREFLRRYPDLATPLAECFDGLELVHQVAERDTQLPGGRLSAWTANGDAPVAPLGDFQIVREIGRGGMGIVYEAVQLSLGRRVALKVLPFAAALDSKHLQRFHNEAQAAAQLHHTNIVPVYAVGSDRGVHFYAMQLIEGQSLAEVIDQLRRAAGKRSKDAWSSSNDLASEALPRTGSLPDSRSSSRRPTNSTSSQARAETLALLSVSLSAQHTGKRQDFFRSAARFIVQAADALEYAHQMGVVHRDIKPGNLLCDARGRLWITDFGLAQFHVDAGLTQTGDVFGTLRYMSPEQAEGRTSLLDHHTDVYALGATLYELATLEPLFAGGNRQELLQQIIHDEPKAPRSLEKNLPVDLETIILKAVSKEPRDRYASAAEMAADLNRFLEDKPILARRPTLVQRARKWSRRHPSVVASGVLVLLVCIAALLIYNRSIAAEQANTARRAEEAEEQYRIARSHVDKMVQITEEETANDPRLQSIRKRLLEAALEYYQRFIEQRREDPAAQVELAATRDRVRKILDDLALLQGAGQFFLLSEPAVLEDLGLTVKQRSDVDELSRRLDAERHEAFRDFHQLSPDQRTERFLELARSQETAMESLLTAVQVARLRQIAMQLQGPTAFRDPEIAEALALTTEQRERIRAIEADSMFGPPPEGRGPGGRGPGGRGPGARDAEGFVSRGRGGPRGEEPDRAAFEGPDRPGRGGPREGTGPPDRLGGPRSLDPRGREPDEARREAMTQILSLLTNEQRAAWDVLTGAAYRGPVMFFPGPPRGGGPRGPERAPEQRPSGVGPRRNVGG